jgi:hypothetical protein
MLKYRNGRIMEHRGMKILREGPEGPSQVRRQELSLSPTFRNMMNFSHLRGIPNNLESVYTIRVGI